MISQCEVVPGTEFRVISDICELEFADGRFDGVLCSSVLEYLDSPPTALCELRRVLKEDGLLIVSVPNSHFWTRLNLLATYWLSKPFGQRRQFTFLDHSKWSYSPETFSQLLHKSGFFAIEHRKYGECRFRNLGLKGEGTMIMFLARPLPPKDGL
jgi:ubiquinone/menaquinone biosynthesis C-methylase UbiE